MVMVMLLLHLLLIKTFKDLDSVTTGKTITKEITLKDPSGTGETVIKKDGDRITYTNDGGTTVHKVANLKDENTLQQQLQAMSIQ